MDSATRDLIRAHLEKAAAKLAVARRLRAAGDHDDAVSRAYYAAFHAVRALLVSAGQTATTHHGAVTLFNLLFVKTGRIGREVGRYFANLKDDRESVDYDLFADADDAQSAAAVEEAEKLLVATQTYLKREALLD